MIIAVPEGEIDHVWPMVSVLLKPAVDLDTGRHALDDVKRDLTECKRQLWAAILDGTCVAVVVTGIAQYPGRTICQAQYGGGSRLDDWLPDILNVVEEWAGQIGCSAIEVVGRRGWVRKLAPYGFSHERVFIEREIPHERRRHTENHAE